MKVIIIILNLIFFLISCTTKNHAYLHGYIYDYNMKPIEGIKVEDPYDATTYSITNKTGYFKINHLIKGEFLYVKKNNKNDRDTFVSTKETKMPLYIVRYQIMWV